MQLGLGTAALGRPQYINLRQTAPKAKHLDDFRAQSLAVIQEAYQSGIRYFDTAPGYGMAEDIIIQWLKTVDDESVQIASKWGYTYTANFNANAKVHEVKEHSLSKLKSQWQISKQLLPFLKVYQIHSATFASGVLQNEAVLEYLFQLKEDYNLNIGITVTGHDQVEVIKKALDVSVEAEQLFDVFQVTYNILDQSLAEVYPDLEQQGKRIVIKEALANGRVFRNKDYSRYNQLYDVTERIAANHNVGVDAVLLQYCAQTISNAVVLSGASSKTQLSENLKMNTLQLSEAELYQLQQFKIQPSAYWQERKQLAWH